MSGSKFADHIAQLREFEQLALHPSDLEWIQQYSKPDRSAEVVLYLGCNILRTPHLACEVVDVFQAMGVDFVAVGGAQFCCGIVHHRAGDIAGANRLARAAALKFEAFCAKQVVVWCPTCQLRFEEMILKGLLPRFPVTHATSFLAERSAQIPFHRSVPARVAVHTHVGSAQRDADARAAIKLLSTVPGVEVIGSLSSPELDYHCSPASMMKIGDQRFRSIRDNLVRDARELGVDTLVTLYHSCHREWCDVAGDGLAVRNYISLVAESLGRGRRDYYQEFKKLGDAEAIAALSRPVWESHGLTEERAKELAIKYFVPKKP